MSFTLSSIEQKPASATYNIGLNDGEIIKLRPLERNDVKSLATFLEGLSLQTREMSTFDSYDRSAAKELCDAINKYDKLRFVLEVTHPKTGPRVVGLIELSFDIPETDKDRYKSLGINLDPEIDVRFGPTISDDYQGQGLGTRVFPYVREIARQFGKKRIILWGGVLKKNTQAIHYYEKNGFKAAGSFINKDGSEVIDMIAELQ